MFQLSNITGEAVLRQTEPDALQLLPEEVIALLVLVLQHFEVRAALPVLQDDLLLAMRVGAQTKVGGLCRR